jgi:predicted cytidylate kinase
MVVITISGRTGAGNTTVAKLLAKKLKLRYVNAFSLFYKKKIKEKEEDLLTVLKKEDKKIDVNTEKIIKEEARKGNIVIDAKLSGWSCKDYADLKVFLTANKKERIKRIGQREGASVEAVLKREKEQRLRFKKIYGIDYFDKKWYDVVIDTTDLTPEEVVDRIVEELRSREIIK